MEKYIPLEKRSKKEKQTLAKASRSTWGPLNPVTRKPVNPKAYNRKKARREEEFFDGGLYILITSKTTVFETSATLLRINPPNGGLR